MPEQICNTCLNKLEVAYEFRKQCEHSDAILQSFIENDLPETINDRSVTVNSESGTIYKYKPPDGLNIKRVKAEAQEVYIKTEPYSDQEVEEEEEELEQEEDIEEDEEEVVIPEKAVYRKVVRPPTRKTVSKPEPAIYLVQEVSFKSTILD